jgi:hypothetical protein
MGWHSVDNAVGVSGTLTRQIVSQWCGIDHKGRLKYCFGILRGIELPI